jgi:hypothetical protein
MWQPFFDSLQVPESTQNSIYEMQVMILRMHSSL